MCLTRLHAWMNGKPQQKIYYANLNLNLMVENKFPIKSGIMITVDVSTKKLKYVKKIYIWNPSAYSCKNGKYLASIIDDSVITCDEVIDMKERKTIPKNIICERKRFFILITFLLTTIALLIAFSI